MSAASLAVDADPKGRRVHSLTSKPVQYCTKRQ